jgi:cytochrome c
MKSYMIAALAVATVAFAGVAQADEAMEKEAKEKGCLMCHAVDKKKVGPAYKDVAAKYKGQADAEAKLVAKVSAGAGTEAGGHPKTKANEADVKKLVHWVLSL